jgi:hypothetical protein
MKTLSPVTDKTTYERCIFECESVGTKTLFRNSPVSIEVPYAMGTLKYLDGTPYTYQGMPFLKGLQLSPGSYYVTVKFDFLRQIVSVDSPFNGSGPGQESLQ